MYLSPVMLLGVLDLLCCQNIELVQDYHSLMNCRTSTALTCNGVSGQWRRVAYLDTSQINIECPRSLKATTNSPLCRIFGSSSTCSSLIFSSGGLPYSSLWHNIWKIFRSSRCIRYTPNDRPLSYY